MKRLTDAQCEQIQQHVRAQLAEQSASLPREYSQSARFEAPLGEWIDKLSGFALVLRLRGKLPQPTAITRRDRFNAQGLEGKIAIDTDLGTAIVYWTFATPQRRAVYV